MPPVLVCCLVGFAVAPPDLLDAPRYFLPAITGIEYLFLSTNRSPARGILALPLLYESGWSSAMAEKANKEICPTKITVAHLGMAVAPKAVKLYSDNRLDV